MTAVSMSLYRFEQLDIYIYIYIEYLEAHGSALDLGTMLQVSRSRVRFLMRPLNFFFQLT
jgi:hypothetical protein